MFSKLLRVASPVPLPLPGETNVGVRLGVVPATGGSVRWMDVHVGRGGSPEAEEEEYLARVMWLPDNSLAVQVHTPLQWYLHRSAQQSCTSQDYLESVLWLPDKRHVAAWQ